MGGEFPVKGDYWLFVFGMFDGLNLHVLELIEPKRVACRDLTTIPNPAVRKIRTTDDKHTP
jgi:hypothetical protein